MAEGTIFIISAPSGAGKTSLIQKILKNRENSIFSISFTTRPPRNNEINGKDYFFINNDQFKSMIENNEFLEFAKVHNYYYGTGKDYVFKNIRKGKNVILDIDYQGAKIVKNNIKDTSISLISIFILPPSFEVLKERLVKRGTDSEEVINLRLKNALREIKHSLTYDYLIINDKLDKAFNELEAIFTCNSLKSEFIKDKVKEIIKSYKGA